MIYRAIQDGTFHLYFLLICRKSLHWIAFTGRNTFVHFTCGRSTRGASLVQCITFGNCTLCTTCLGRCKSSAIQYNRRTEAHRLVESSCWKRTGNLFGHKTTSNNEKKTELTYTKLGTIDDRLFAMVATRCVVSPIFFNAHRAYTLTNYINCTEPFFFAVEEIGHKFVYSTSAVFLVDF